MHGLLTALWCSWLMAPPPWPPFSPAQATLWQPIYRHKVPPGAQTSCGLKGNTEAYPAHKPKLFFLAESPSPMKYDPNDHTVHNAKVHLYQQGGACTPVFTCAVPGEELSTDVESVWVGPEHAYMFMCGGQADNGSYFQVKIDTPKPTVLTGPGFGDLDVRDPWTGAPNGPP